MKEYAKKFRGRVQPAPVSVSLNNEQERRSEKCILPGTGRDAT